MRRNVQRRLLPGTTQGAQDYQLFSESATKVSYTVHSPLTTLPLDSTPSLLRLVRTAQLVSQLHRKHPLTLGPKYVFRRRRGARDRITR